MMNKSYNAHQLRTLMRSRRVSFEVAARSFDLVASRGCSLDAALEVAVKEEQDEVAGRGAVRKTAPSAVIPIKAPTSNPYKRLASKEHRQNNTLRKALGGSPAPAPSAPAPTHNKAVEIGGLVFAGSVAETIEGAAR